MTTCLTALHIWTLRNQSIIADTDVGVFAYHEKNEEGLEDHQYLSEKAAFTESRDVTWTPKNKRPDKVKDTLKEAEDLMTQTKCIKCRWVEQDHVLVILATGALIWFKTSTHTGDVDKIKIDKSLVGKLSADNPSDVLFTENYLVFCYPDKPKLDYIYYMKKPDTAKKADKLSTYDPRIAQVELIGPMNRKLDRKLDCSLHEDIVLVWWPTSSYEAWPWSPMTSDKERANLALYAANGPRLELVAYTRTDCDPMSVQCSMVNQDQLLSVEQSQSAAGEIQAHVSVYECSRHRMSKQWTSRVPVRSAVTCFGRSPGEDKLVVGCQDGTLILYDHYHKSSHTAHTAFKPQHISWHPSGVFVFVASTKGEIQVFDMALSPLSVQLVAEHQSPAKILQLGKYFRTQPNVTELAWNPGREQSVYVLPECRDSLAILCDRGPVVMLQFYMGVLTQGQMSPLSLVKQYVKNRQLDEAIAVLSCLNWNLEGQTCFACANTILNHLLRNTLSPKTEEQLESTLGTFYAPARALSELTVLEYRDPMSRLARRFFHSLLRYARFEKAFLLAVDIGARDLFMDIHYMATDRGELALAEVARRKADEIEAESLAVDPLYDDDQDDALRHSDDDGSEGTYSSGDEYYRDSAPPQIPPRVPVAPPLADSRVGAPGGRAPVGPPPPPPPQFANPPADARFANVLQRPVQPQQGLIPAAEAIVEGGEAYQELKWNTEYTATLLDEPILPPPPSHADNNPGDTQPKPSSIRVIHFGIV